MNTKLPPRGKDGYLQHYEYFTVPQKSQTKYVKRQSTDQDVQSYKSSSVQKTNDSGIIKQPNGMIKSNGISRANTQDKKEIENGRQNHISSITDNQTSMISLYQVKNLAKPEFENFKRDRKASLKNHSFLTQLQKQEKPHSFKQLISAPHSKISNLYYIGDLQDAILNQRGRSSESFREHIQISYNYIPIIRKFEVDKKQIKEKKLNIPQRNNKKYNKTIVFDMDETLIHCNEDENDQCQFKLPIEFEDGEVIVAGINVRNFAKEIIYKLSEVCEVIIFTASQDIYANKVINILDPNKKLSYRIFRESCITVGENYLIKNLEVLNRDLKNVVLVDNASYSFAHHLENGIPIISFYNDEKDNQLIKLYRYLCSYILPAEDVRPLILEHFKLNRLNEYESVEDAVKNLYF